MMLVGGFRVSLSISIMMDLKRLYHRRLLNLIEMGILGLSGQRGPTGNCIVLTKTIY